MVRSAGNRDEFRSWSWQDLLIFPMWDTSREREEFGMAATLWPGPWEEGSCHSQDE